MIKQQSIEQLKQSACIGQVVGHYIKLDNHGKAFCPFHEEKSPSFTVTEKLGIFKCYGCGQGGDVFSFVQDYENVDFIQAVEIVAQLSGFTLEHENETPETRENRQKAKDEQTQLYDFNAWLADVYAQALSSSTTAQEYLLKRGYGLEDARKVELGYAPDSFDFIKNKCIDNGTLPIALKLGVVRESEKGNIYDFWRDRIMFPIRDKRGNICGFTGRYIGQDEKTAKERKYMNSTESHIFTKEAQLFGIDRAHKTIQKEQRVYLVEGSFCVTSAHLWAMTNTVATCGTSLSATQVRMLKGFGASEIYLLRDNDPAGRKATYRDINLIAENGLIPNVCILRGVKDLDEKIQIERTNEA